IADGEFGHDTDPFTRACALHGLLAVEQYLRDKLDDADNADKLYEDMTSVSGGLLEEHEDEDSTILLLHLAATSGWFDDDEGNFSQIAEALDSAEAVDPSVYGKGGLATADRAALVRLAARAAARGHVAS